jgi:hypothetical protein
MGSGIQDKSGGTIVRFLLILLLLLGGFGQGLAREPEVALGTVRGRLQLPETERYSGVVSLWNADQISMPDPRRYILIPSTAGPIDPDGRFLLRVPAGRYYLGAILRLTPGPPLGPPRVGDRILLTPDAQGDELVVEVGVGETVDVGSQGGGWLYQGFSDEEVTGVSGQVTDAGGKPQEGLLVFAFLDPEMSGQPLAVSTRSDAEGRYLLRLPAGGEVYLRVRENYGGGSPVAGGVMGVYGNGAPRPVAVVPGRVQAGIDISTLLIPEIRTGNRPAPGAPPGSRAEPEWRRPAVRP